ncbi:MAG TPA: phosphoribosylformylglycinamidine synthase subunit PurS [Tepidisphaeraceae bacterium]|jgi:phosphoribosylformylglycinamidine synthase|nr:phosphoribosylformylglycinamidine synthase subunit PurS [Tepidisphaeraceae bacterium]
MIYRIDVQTAPLARGGVAAVDPLGEAVRHQIQEFGKSVGKITTRRIFLIDADADPAGIERAAKELFADPVVESAEIMTFAPDDSGHSRIEIHLKPGVMDPVAASTEMALRDMGIMVREVRTGRSYVVDGNVPRSELQEIASRVLANGVIESVHFDAYLPKKFETGRDYQFHLRHVSIRDLDDAGLQKLSREGHLFLSPAEMKAVQSYFRGRDREPTDIELETIAQTWSEHCVHKTLKSAVDVEVQDVNGKVLSTRRYKNLIKETIFDSTMQLMRRDRATAGVECLSVFADNAGVIGFDETDAVCFKAETHNHPSAIEPYGGSATGVGGVIRDILGTGLAAKPIANTDVFCVAFPNAASPLPKGIIHPKRILQQVVAGVRDYGNRMGIPTVNGAVYFDDRYLGNPLVFCGCVGLIPRDKIHKETGAGDAVVVMGGRTGRDGIHGATFSSAELTDTHADEFSHAVQIGNAITEKKVGDVILQARDRGLFSAVTDCGAGGLSSAVGEMGEKIGAAVDLEKVPLKYAGLRYDEIWISEAQERMVLAVPGGKLDELLALAKSEDVETTVVGVFGTAERDLILNYHGTQVARMSMDFIHRGIPMPTRKAVVVHSDKAPGARNDSPPADGTIRQLLQLLAHPNIASKHWIIRQYDHEVQGGSVIKPLTGPLQIGPSDAAVLRPKLNSHRGVVVGCGLSPHIEDAYEMSIAAIDEAIRNVVAVGADPNTLAILDNFCWPSVDDEKTMGTLVRACEACRDAALAFGIPFISGKDSLHNQFTDGETGRVIRIPNTLLISAIGVVDDVRKCVTMDLKNDGGVLYLVAAQGLNASAHLANLIETHRRIHDLISRGYVASCHDVSDGGALTALAEMCIASGLGAWICPGIAATTRLFAEGSGAYIVEANPSMDDLKDHLKNAPCDVLDIGHVTREPALDVENNGTRESVTVADLTRAWRGTLDW